nr:hypothetical protein [Cytophagales bacterium]
MQVLVTLFIFTLSYGLLFLSLFPVRSLRRIPNETPNRNQPGYRQYDLTWPYFLSFLGGYVLASIMVYLIKDWI